MWGIFLPWASHQNETLAVERSKRMAVEFLKSCNQVKWGRIFCTSMIPKRHPVCFHFSCRGCIFFVRRKRLKVVKPFPSFPLTGLLFLGGEKRNIFCLFYFLFPFGQNDENSETLVHVKASPHQELCGNPHANPISHSVLDLSCTNICIQSIPFHSSLVRCHCECEWDHTGWFSCFNRVICWHSTLFWHLILMAPKCLIPPIIWWPKQNFFLNCGPPIPGVSSWSHTLSDWTDDVSVTLLCLGNSGATDECVLCEGFSVNCPLDDGKFGLKEPVCLSHLESNVSWRQSNWPLHYPQFNFWHGRPMFLSMSKRMWECWHHPISIFQWWSHFVDCAEEMKRSSWWAPAKPWTGWIITANHVLMTYWERNCSTQNAFPLSLPLLHDRHHQLENWALFHWKPGEWKFCRKRMTIAIILCCLLVNLFHHVQQWAVHRSQNPRVENIQFSSSMMYWSERLWNCFQEGLGWCQSKGNAINHQSKCRVWNWMLCHDGWNPMLGNSATSLCHFWMVLFQQNPCWISSSTSSTMAPNMPMPVLSEPSPVTQTPVTPAPLTPSALTAWSDLSV